MKRALPFVLVLVAGAATWALAIHPLQEESAARAAGAGRVVPGIGPADAGIRERLDSALLDLSPPEALGPRPPIPGEAGTGVHAGRLRWAEVQDLLVWAASLDVPPASLEIKVSPDDPESADCRVVLAPVGRK